MATLADRYRDSDGWFRTYRFVQAGCAEGLGTAFLTYFGVLAVLSSSIVTPVTNGGRIIVIAAAFGLAGVVAIYIASVRGHGHINPAVTLGMMINRHVSIPRGFWYMFMQCVGGIVGAAFVKATVPWSVQGNLGSNTVFSPFSAGNAWCAEIIGTAFLVGAALSTFNRVPLIMNLNNFYNKRRNTRSNLGKAPVGSEVNKMDSMATGELPESARATVTGPIYIGFAIFVAHLALIPITGTSINPARSLGPAVVGNYWNHAEIFYVAPFLGAIGISIIWFLLNVGRDTEMRKAAKQAHLSSSNPPAT